MLVFTGITLPVHQVDRVVGPVSVVTEISGQENQPLQSGFVKIWESAQSMGANAVVGLSCSIFPDGTRALLVGTAVFAKRIN
mgnify:CR=1 FL=1